MLKGDQHSSANFEMQNVAGVGRAAAQGMGLGMMGPVGMILWPVTCLLNFPEVASTCVAHYVAGFEQ